jgi:hypothetical protein
MGLPVRHGLSTCHGHRALLDPGREFATSGELRGRCLGRSRGAGRLHLRGRGRLASTTIIDGRSHVRLHRGLLRVIVADDVDACGGRQHDHCNQTSAQVSHLIPPGVMPSRRAGGTASAVRADHFLVNERRTAPRRAARWKWGHEDRTPVSACRGPDVALESVNLLK